MNPRWWFARLGELAPRLGFTMEVDPYLGEFARLRFGDGDLVYVSPSAVDLNPGTSSELAKMPALVMPFLAAAGLSVPAFESIAAGAEVAMREQAARVAGRLGYPLVLRSSGRQGVGPYLATDAEILFDLAAQVLTHAPALILQQPVWGPQVRVIVLNGEARFGFERVPWRIVGDGARSVQELLAADRERHPVITLALDDWRIDDMLEFGRRTRATVPAAGEPVQVALTPRAEHGGSVRGLPGGVPPDLAELACRATRESGLVFGGVDLVRDPRGVWVLDVQPAPDLEAYEALGEEFRREVALLLEALIRALRGRVSGASPKGA